MMKITRMHEIDYYKNEHLVWIGAIFLVCMWIIWSVDEFDNGKNLR